MGIKIAKNEKYPTKYLLMRDKVSPFLVKDTNKTPEAAKRKRVKSKKIVLDDGDSLGNPFLLRLLWYFLLLGIMISIQAMSA